MMKTLFRTALCILASVGMTPAGVRAQALSEKFKQAVPIRSATASPDTVRRGQTVTLSLTFGLAPGWHTYPTRQTDPKAEDYVNQITITPPKGVILAGELQEPKALSKEERDLQIKDLRYYQGTFTWKRDLVVLPSATPGKKDIKASVRMLVCDENHCLPPQNVSLTASFTVTNADPVPIDPKYKGQVEGGGAGPSTRLGSSDPNETPTVHQSRQAEAPVGQPFQADQPSQAGKPDLHADDHRAELQAILAQFPRDSTAPTGLISFLLAGIFWGGVSLITPCVFPMIPITVSFFLKQSEKEHHRPIAMAVVYSLTIIVVLTFSAVVLLSFFRLLSISPKMNFALGALFVFFALSLFGMYDIQLPAGLARLTSAREGQGGLVGTMFMALTFTIVSFACVAPFLGGFGGTAAGSDLTLTERVLGGLAFSATFAAPFFVLALFPSLLRKLPKSGSWLNTVKVVMGFLELAAALKFFARASWSILRPLLFSPMTWCWACGSP